MDEFEAALLAAARALPDQAGRLAFACDYLRLRTGAPSRAALPGMLSRQFAGERWRGSRRWRGMMNDDRSPRSSPASGPTTARSTACWWRASRPRCSPARRTWTSTRPKVRPRSAPGFRPSIGWPKSLTDVYESTLNATFFDLCKEFTPRPRPGFHDPVTAPIPTLVLQGAFDTQTAPSWGALMVSSLPKGRLVFLPESGHGTLAFSQCAKDIGSAFLENPEAPFDASCADALTPAFLLPDGTWSR